MALLAALEDPPTGSGPADRTHDPRVEREEPFEPEGRPRGATDVTPETTIQPGER